MIICHAEATADPALMRWVFSGVTLTAGVVTDCPLTVPGARLHIVAETQALWIRLDGASWAAIGATVQAMLPGALADPDSWCTTVSAEEVRLVATQVLDGQVGTYARSHGGDLTLLGVGDDWVSIRTHGACTGCPALSLTVRARLRGQLQARLGRDVLVSTEGGG